MHILCIEYDKLMFLVKLFKSYIVKDYNVVDHVLCKSNTLRKYIFNILN